MARALHHVLHTSVPRPFDQVAQGHELRDLRLIGCVVYASGPEAVPQGQGELVLPGHLQEIIVILEQRVLLLVVEDPRREERSAPRHDVHEATALLQPCDGLAGDSAVDGHEVHPVLCMLLDAVEDVVLGHLDDRVSSSGRQPCLIYRNGTHHHGALRQQSGTYSIDISAGAKVHDRVRTVSEPYTELLQLRIEIDDVPGGPQVHVDLHRQAFADSSGLGVMHGIMGGADAPGGNSSANELRADAFFLGYTAHKVRDLAAAGLLHYSAHRRSDEYRLGA